MWRASVCRRGQSILEYAALLSIVAAALVAMVVYARRGVSGGLRNAADTVGRQYDPKNTASNFTLSVVSDRTVSSVLEQNLVLDPGNNIVGDVIVTTVTLNEATNRTGSENVGALNSSLW